MTFQEEAGYGYRGVFVLSRCSYIGIGNFPGVKRRFRHDQDEDVTLEVDLAGEVVVRDGLEVTAFSLGEPGGVEAGGIRVRGHGKSFRGKYRNFVLLLYVVL